MLITAQEVSLRSQVCFHFLHSMRSDLEFGLFEFVCGLVAFGDLTFSHGLLISRGDIMVKALNARD